MIRLRRDADTPSSLRVIDRFVGGWPTRRQSSEHRGRADPRSTRTVSRIAPSPDRHRAFRAARPARPPGSICGFSPGVAPPMSSWERFVAPWCKPCAPNLTAFAVRRAHSVGVILARVTGTPMFDPKRLRDRMVEVHLAGRGITDSRVLDAFRSVPREAFVADELAEFAYADTPLPIGQGQTISQPYIVAFTVQALALHGSERVLEVGTGSGYAAAILGRLAKSVCTIERVPELADAAKDRLARLGFDNVRVTCGDGSLGWPEHAPYDAIAVAAGGPKAPPALLSQLAIGGRLVIPIGDDESSQILTCITREDETEFRYEPLADVRFVPLIGEQAWDESARLVRSPRRTSPVRRPGHPGPRSGRTNRRHRRRVARCAHRSYRRRAARPARRGVARHERVLPDARAHHARAHCPSRLPVRGGGGRLARRFPDRRLRARGRSTLEARLHALRALPDVDVAQRGGARLRRLAPRVQRGPSPAQGGLPRARSLQPLHVDRGGPRVPRRGRPRRCEGRAPPLQQR